jgi:hypothetical protein
VPSGVQRFLGGSPGGVLVKLIFLSLVVGGLMSLLGLTPQALFEGVWRMVRSVLDLGFGALGEVGGWLVTGAIVVVPLWLLLRLFDRR